MKILQDNRVFIQKKNLDYLTNYLLSSSKSYPNSFVEELLKHKFYNEVKDVTFIEFNNPEIANFFRDITCIANYDDVKNKSIYELEVNINIIINDINSLINDYKKSNNKELLPLIKEKKLLAEDLNDYINYLKSKSILKFPNSFSKKKIKYYVRYFLSSKSHLQYQANDLVKMVKYR